MSEESQASRDWADESDDCDWEAEYRAQCKINYQNWSELASLKSQLAELEVYRHEFRQLMAIMHHDGGHYEAEHGPKKARIDALVEYYKRVNKVDVLQKDREMLLGYLREIAVYGNKHMPAPEYAQKALAAMEARTNPLITAS